MRRTFYAIVCLAVAASAHARVDDKALRQEFTTLYAKIGARFKAKDAAGLAKMMTADFAMDHMGEKSNRKQTQDLLAQSFSLLDTLENTWKLGKITLRGGEAVVETTYVMTADMGPDPKTGKSRLYITDCASTDTWIKKGGQWMLKRINVTKDKLRANG